jgi:hypothetical protein
LSDEPVPAEGLERPDLFEQAERLERLAADFDLVTTLEPLGRHIGANPKADPGRLAAQFAGSAQLGGTHRRSGSLELLEGVRSRRPYLAYGPPPRNARRLVRRRRTRGLAGIRWCS